MKSRRVLVSLAVLALAACGGGGEAEGGDAGADTGAAGAPPPPPVPAGTADTTGMGTSPPTAGGQIVDTAAVPGPADTTKGTPTAP